MLGILRETYGDNRSAPTRASATFPAAFDMTTLLGDYGMCFCDMTEHQCWQLSEVRGFPAKIFSVRSDEG